MENYEKLIEWYKNHKSFCHTRINDNEYKEIIKLTSFLDDNFQKIKFSQRIWHIKNNDFSLKYCKICGKLMEFNNTKRRYDITCSRDCYYHYNKTKEFTDKIVKTHKKKYGGIGFASKTITKKQKKTSIEKYGTEIYSRTEEYKEKKEKTCSEKYGVYNVMKCENIKNKLKLTNKERYGVENFSMTDRFKEIMKDKESINFEEELIKSNYYKLGYKLISNLKNQSDYEIYCPKCKSNFVINRVNNYYVRKNRNQEICTNCNPIQKNYSCGEKEIVDFIRSIYTGEIIENSRSVISPYELGIYLPVLNLAVEYNGLYWHSSEQKNDNYHYNKTNKSIEIGMRLIHVFEDDWIYKKDIIKSILQTSINTSLNTKIYARKCIIKEVSLKDTNIFLSQNHINGKVLTQSICYGLFFQDELVSLMSFRKNKDHYDLQRYAIKLNNTILGGAEKLFSNFIKNIEFDYIITYADRSLFSGKIYDKLGFEFVRENKPNFMFFNSVDNIRVSKQSIRNDKNGYKRENDKMYRIYNSGINVYKYKKK